MKKAVFLDIDGTILNCNDGIISITPAVTEALNKLKAEGHYVFIATGRPFAFLGKDILNYGFSGFILNNGSNVIVHNRTIYKECMNKNFVRECIEMFEKNHIQYILEDEKYSYMQSKFEDYYKFYASIGISDEYIKSNYSLNDINILKIEMLCKNEHISSICYDFIKKNEDYDFDHSINKKFFELFPKRNTKASGILKVLKHLNISIENSYAFGDGKNDIEMLSTVGCGIAMGNSNNEVKKHAKYITKSVNDDGVAHGIYKYILT